MSGAFRYKPKFVDIRVRPPKPGQPEAAEPTPEARLCDHPGCRQPATAEAPKSRERMQDRYAFCAPHAAEYNRGWNYFEGMSEGEIRAHHEASFTGDRPTWDFKASPRSREAAAFAARMNSAAGLRDAFGLFGGKGPRPRPEPGARHLGRLERNAFADLNLDESADGPAIRARYTELVKRFHPDVNGGDRSAEEKLQRVIKAYKTLRGAKLA
jgi:hypothetical protein